MMPGIPRPNTSVVFPPSTSSDHDGYASLMFHGVVPLFMQHGQPGGHSTPVFSYNLLLGFVEQHYPNTS